MSEDESVTHRSLDSLDLDTRQDLLFPWPLKQASVSSDSLPSATLPPLPTGGLPGFEDRAPEGPRQRRCRDPLKRRSVTISSVCSVHTPGKPDVTLQPLGSEQQQQQQKESSPVALRLDAAAGARGVLSRRPPRLRESLEGNTASTGGTGGGPFKLRPQRRSTPRKSKSTSSILAGSSPSTTAAAATQKRPSRRRTNPSSVAASLLEKGPSMRDKMVLLQQHELLGDYEDWARREFVEENLGAFRVLQQLDNVTSATQWAERFALLQQLYDEFVGPNATTPIGVSVEAKKPVTDLVEQNVELRVASKKGQGSQGCYLDPSQLEGDIVGPIRRELDLIMWSTLKDYATYLRDSGPSNSQPVSPDKSSSTLVTAAFLSGVRAPLSASMPTLSPAASPTKRRSMRKQQSAAASQLEFVLTDFSLMHCFCELLANDVEVDEVVTVDPIISLMDRLELIGDFISFCVGKEVDQCAHPSILFRSRSASTVLLKRLLQRPAFKKYLKRLCSNTVSKIVAGPPVGKDRIEHLISCCHSMLADITTSISYCPTLLRQLFGSIRQQTEWKFPEGAKSVAGSLLFLRFIVPSIVMPSQYGMISEPPSKDARKDLLLFSRVLQNMASGFTFEEEEVELSQFNSFIDFALAPIASFLDTLLDARSIAVGSKAKSSSKTSKKKINASSKAVAHVLQAFQVYKQPLEESLTDWASRHRLESFLSHIVT